MAQAEAELREAARRAGYEYRDDLALDDLAFTEPPWLVPHPPFTEPKLLRSIHKDTPQARFAMGDFYYNSLHHYWTQTVGAVWLRRVTRGLDEYLSKAGPEAGARCVRRGACVYVYVDAFSTGRSAVLNLDERIACLDALERIAAGEFAAASKALASIRPSVAWRFGNVVRWALLAAPWLVWGWFLATTPNATYGLLLGGVILAAVYAFFHRHLGATYRDAREYAARRSG